MSTESRISHSLDSHVELKPEARAKATGKQHDMIRPVILAGHRIVLYSKALHPEHVDLHGRRTIMGPGNKYELEAWVMEGSHALRLEYGTLCATELVCEHERAIPTGSIVFSHVVNAEKDVEHKFTKHGVRYMSSIQLEILAPNLYYDTYEELLQTARGNNHLVHMWNKSEGQGLSLVEIDRKANEVSILGFHLIPATGTVVRTQTLFELIKPGDMTGLR